MDSILFKYALVIDKINKPNAKYNGFSLSLDLFIMNRKYTSKVV